MTTDRISPVLDGQLLMPGDAGYDDARTIWNALVDRRPAMIVRCAGVADVVTAVRTARDLDLEIGIRCGGHNALGFAVPDQGLMIDLSPMGGVRVDPVRQRAWVQGGALLGALDTAAQRYGLATTAGNVSHTGVGGLTLGGGMGWLARQHRLTCDNVISFEVVTATGEVVRASRHSHPDLYWGLRGGGGNFGVVTEFEFRLHPVGPLAQLGMFFWDLADGAAALALAQQVTAALPPRMGSLIIGLNAPPAPFVPEQHHFRPGYALCVAAFGADAEHARLAGEVRAALPPLFEFVSPVPYVALQQMLDEAGPWGILAYEKSLYLDALSPQVIDVITGQMARKQSPMSLLIIAPMGGAFCDVPDDATAFGGSRAPGIAISATAIAPAPDLLAADTAWAREFWSGLLPHAPGIGSYVNFMTDYDADRVRASYGPAKYQRLARIKAGYDPGNVFHRNPNIIPAG
jgi:FAD/FMN-containing dehydrogenase